MNVVLSYFWVVIILIYVMNDLACVDQSTHMPSSQFLPPFSPTQVWICPACGLPDDGSPMIGCDGVCNAWYHFVCVGLTEGQLPEESVWYCRNCAPPGNKRGGVVQGGAKGRPLLPGKAGVETLPSRGKAAGKNAGKSGGASAKKGAVSASRMISTPTTTTKTTGKASKSAAAAPPPPATPGRSPGRSGRGSVSEKSPPTPKSALRPPAPVGSAKRKKKR